MIHPGYVLPRLIRHFMPSGLARGLLRRKMIIRPGIETLNPAEAIERYRADLQDAGCTLEGKSILVFGYGGNFAVGCGLLDLGAGRVILCDRFAPPDDQRNRALLPHFSKYLVEDGGHILPKDEYIDLLEADIRLVPQQRLIEPVDLVISSSVFEHLDDVAGITCALAAVTKDGGMNLHYIDLRDHFFRYPFEMLRYSSRTWKSWLNPGSNLNRYRLWQYREVFYQHFSQVDITVLQSAPAAFEILRRYIRPEFVSGNLEEDCATYIRVAAVQPKR